jgi:hypothetical protein
MTVYETQLMAARLRQLGLLDDQAKRMDKALKGAYADIENALENVASGSEDTIKPARLAGLKRELDAIMDGTMDTVNDYIEILLRRVWFIIIAFLVVFGRDGSLRPLCSQGV